MINENSMAFTPEEIPAAKDFIEALIDFNVKSEKSYNDIHIHTDGYCLIVDWMHKTYEYDHRKYTILDEDERIYTEVHLPDNSYIEVPKGEEDQALEEFLKDNPGWYKGDYGVWRWKGDNDNCIDNA